MRALLRTVTIIGGAAAIAVVVLLCVAAGTGSWGPAVAAAILATTMVIAGVVVTIRVAERFASTTDRTATRLKNMEQRTAGASDQASELEELSRSRFEELEALAQKQSEHVDALSAELAQLADRVHAASSRLDGSEADVAGLRRELDAAGLAITGTRTKVEETLRTLDDLRTGVDRNSDDVASLGTRIDEGDAATASVRKSVRNLDAALTRTRERIEPIRRDVRNLRERVPSGFLDPVEAHLNALGEKAAVSLRTAFESAIQLDRDPRSLLTPKQAKELFEYYLREEQYLQLKPLIESFDLLATQNLATLRALYRYYRTAGYWDLALRAVSTLHEKSGRDNDAYAVAKLQSEITVFSEPSLVTADLPEADAYDPRGPILHMVGRVLPETQTGYTLRTQYTVQAQARKGLPVAVVGQAGITGRTIDDIEQYRHEGIDYYLLPGPARNQVLLEDWVRENMVHLAELVRRVRPSILHAQSDFFNALIVSAVGKAYGIPTVYESRGFWEESWLSRTITAQQWTDTAETLFSTYGLPDAYKLRKHAEEVARSLTDHVFTLAEVMREHIIESAQGGLDAHSVSIVPNAVDAESFPVQEPDRELAAEIGLPEGAVTVGYISSIVEYEGIDTLIDAFQLASKNSQSSMCLLLVGDGDHLTTLKSRAARKGIENVVFTGKVPHEDILRYYGLIDVFVVPRKPSRVADLVTPLKPFEAFSTGRAVIVSDVGALQEIADQSGAVETFRAGSADDLARRLVELIGDLERRRELAERGARWVRHQRAWETNAIEYYRVYQALGYAGLVNLAADSELALQERGQNPAELLESMSDSALPPLTGWFSIGKKSFDATALLAEGWTFNGFDPVPVSTITDWSKYSAVHRTWGFRLHSWEFIDPLLRAYDETAEDRWLHEASRIARNWIEFHDERHNVDDPMVWYDMAQALRLPRLLALAFRASRVSVLRDQAIIFAASIMRHLDELHQDSAFNANNNHGFYTAASQLHAAKYAWMFGGAQQAEQDGRKRIAIMTASQFAQDGIQREHSPDYHRMLLGSFEQAVFDDLIDDDAVRGTLKKAAHALGWMVQPDGTLVQMGDSPERKVVRPGAQSIDPQTRFILTDGVEGERPTEELAVFEEGGYAFVRSPQPSGPGTLADAGYLAFSAAFHSRAHKHADDLNIVWYDCGQQLLVDGGRFGYGDLLPADSPLRQKGFYYGSPERQYVEGTMAHNTLMMDAQDHDRRNRKPYGSGIGPCVEKGGRFDLSGRVKHDDFIHRRRAIYTPGSELMIIDSVFSHVEEQRQGILWFNIDGSFAMEHHDGAVVFEHPVSGLRLSVASDAEIIEPVRGQSDPLRGWRSRVDQDLEPAWSLGFSFSVVERASVTTRLTLEASAPA